MQATTCSTLLSSAVKAAERMSKMTRGLYLGFGNLEVIDGFAKSDGVDRNWISED